MDALLAHMDEQDRRIAELLAESDRLRSQLAAEFALSGAIARLEQLGVLCSVMHEGDGRWHVRIASPRPSFAYGDTFLAALTSALDEAEGIA